MRIRFRIALLIAFLLGLASLAYPSEANACGFFGRIFGGHRVRYAACYPSYPCYPSPQVVYSAPPVVVTPCGIPNCPCGCAAGAPCRCRQAASAQAAPACCNLPSRSAACPTCVPAAPQSCPQR